MPPDPFTQSIVWALLFVFALGPHSSVSGPAKVFGPKVVMSGWKIKILLINSFLKRACNDSNGAPILGLDEYREQYGVRKVTGLPEIFYVIYHFYYFSGSDCKPDQNETRWNSLWRIVCAD